MAAATGFVFPRLRGKVWRLYQTVRMVLGWCSTGTSGFFIGCVFTLLYVWVEGAYWIAGVNLMAKYMPFLATTTPSLRAIDCCGKALFLAVGWLAWDRNTPEFNFPRARD